MARTPREQFEADLEAYARELYRYFRRLGVAAAETRR